MSTVSCTAVRELAAELALDLLDGDERAAALAHLQTCPACRDEVASLARAADELLLLAPEAEADPDLEARVLDRLGAPAAPAEPTAPVVAVAPAHHHRVRRRLLAAAAAVVLVAAAATLALAARTPDAGPAAAARTASMRTAATGQVVGTVRLASGADATVSIPDWLAMVRNYGGTVGATYWLQVRTTGGDHDLRRLPPADQRPWHIDLGTDPGKVRSVSVVDDKGTVWCTARFTTT